MLEGRRYALVLKKKIPLSALSCFHFCHNYTVTLRSFTIEVPLARMLKRWCRAWQIWNKQCLRRGWNLNEWVKTWCRDSFMQMKTERWRGEASFSIHEVSWPFACRARAHCIVWYEFVCVCLRATSEPPEANTHILYRDNITLLRTEKKHARVCSATHTHARTHASTHALWASTMCMQRGVKQVGGSKQYSMQPTTYNVWSFCFLRQWREREMSI